MDSFKNLARVTVSTGYDASATTVALSSGEGAKLPAAGGGSAFNVVWYNATDYPDPSDDPNVEIVRVTNRSVDTLTVTRAQESTSAATHNTGGKTYKMIATWTALSANMAVSHTGTMTANKVVIGNGGGDTKVTGVGIDSSDNISTSGAVSTGAGASATGQIAISGSVSGTTILSVPNAAGNYTLKLPSADGASGDALKTDGAGNLSFGAVSGGPSGGDLTLATGTDAATTMAANTLYVTDMSGWATADRNYTCPASPTVGDRVGVSVTSGNGAFELIIKGNTSQTINGGSTASEWSRLFITGESVILRYVASNKWIVEVDGRIPCRCHVTRSSAVTTNTAATPRTCVFDTETYDIGGCYDAATNYRINARRAGLWKFDGFIMPNTGPSDANYYYALLFNDQPGSQTATYWGHPLRAPSSSSILFSSAFGGQALLAAGDKVVPAFNAEETDRGIIDTTGASLYLKPFFAAVEILAG